jgi:hypothetical protein
LTKGLVKYPNPKMVSPKGQDHSQSQCLTIQSKLATQAFDQRVKAFFVSKMFHQKKNHHK